MHIEIDRTSVGGGFCVTGFFTYMRSDGAIDDA